MILELFNGYKIQKLAGNAILQYIFVPKILSQYKSIFIFIAFAKKIKFLLHLSINNSLTRPLFLSFSWHYVIILKRALFVYSL